nr:MAG: hypothetical protein [Microvirus sp.]
MDISLKEKEILETAMETEISRLTRASRTAPNVQISDLYGQMIVDARSILSRILMEKPAK